MHIFLTGLLSPANSPYYAISVLSNSCCAYVSFRTPGDKHAALMDVVAGRSPGEHGRYPLASGIVVGSAARDPRDLESMCEMKRPVLALEGPKEALTGEGWSVHALSLHPAYCGPFEQGSHRYLVFSDLAAAHAAMYQTPGIRHRALAPPRVLRADGSRWPALLGAELGHGIRLRLVGNFEFRSKAMPLPPDFSGAELKGAIASFVAAQMPGHCLTSPQPAEATLPASPPSEADATSTKQLGSKRRRTSRSDGPLRSSPSSASLTSITGVEAALDPRAASVSCSCY